MAHRTIAFLAVIAVCASAVELSNEQHEKLPDFGNPQVARRLRCSACRGSAVEYHTALSELRAKRKNAKIKDFEYTEALDAVCESRVSNYGLQLRSNFPTEKFSKDKAISRAQGNWAGRYIANVCAELYADHEEALMQHQKLDLLGFVDAMCRNTLKVCDERSVQDETLGDEAAAPREL